MARVRQIPAPANQAMEVIGIFGVEEQQQPDDGIPRVAALRLDQIGADFAGRSIAELASLRHFLAVHGGRRYRRAVEDAHVLGERRDHELDIHTSQFLRCDAGARFHQEFEPDTEAIGVERLVEPRTGRTPQVQIEDTGELVRCRQRDELAAILEATALNDAVKNVGRQSRDYLSEVWRVQYAIEQTTCIWSKSLGWTAALTPTGTLNGLALRLLEREFFHSTPRVAVSRRGTEWPLYRSGVFRDSLFLS
jgi:hypothetical protein